MRSVYQDNKSGFDMSYFDSLPKPYRDFINDNEDGDLLFASIIIDRMLSMLQPIEYYKSLLVMEKNLKKISLS